MSTNWLCFHCGTVCSTPVAFGPSDPPATEKCPECGLPASESFQKALEYQRVKKFADDAEKHYGFYNDQSECRTVG